MFFHLENDFPIILIENSKSERCDDTMFVKEKNKSEELKAHAVHLMSLYRTMNESEKNHPVLKKFSYHGKTYDMTTLKGNQKHLKDLYKRDFPLATLKERPLPYLINELEHVDESGESKIAVYFFENQPDTMATIKQFLALEGDTNHYDFSPTGLWFTGAAKVIENEKRIIIIQCSSLDC